MTVHHLHLDFETYSDAELRDCGAWAYAMHPSTTIIVAAWSVDGRPAQTWSIHERRPLGLTSLLERDDVIIHAFNANFERAILCHVATRQWGTPYLPPSRFRCTQAHALACSLPGSLAMSAAVLGLGQQKDKTGTRLVKKYCMPRKPTKADGRLRVPPGPDPDGLDDDWAKFVSYCAQDVRTEEAVLRALPAQAWPDQEQAVWEADSAINERGVPIDVPLATGAIRIAADLARVGNHRLAALSNGAVTSATQGKRLKDWCAAQGHPLANLERDALPAVIDALPTGSKVREALSIRLSLAKSSTAKFAAMLAALGPDGRVRGIHQYHSAHTGRWGGRIIQGQNLPRPNYDTSADLHHIRAGRTADIRVMYDDPMDALRDSIRPAITFLDGDEELLVGDWASIEARVLGWIAGEPAYEKAFKDGLDLYKICAAEIYGVRYEDVTKEQRALGKACVLGLGYQMGPDTFIETCRAAPYNITEAQASDAMIRKAAATYRQTYKAIVSYWSAIEQAVVKAILTSQPVTVAPNPRRRVVANVVGKWLSITLPSGRALWYPGAVVTKQVTKWGEAKLQASYRQLVGPANNPWLLRPTYGGRLTENIVQAISRDILAGCLVRLEAHRVRTIMHVHDEIVASVSGLSLDAFLNVMMERPTWAPDLPLKAEGFASPYYRK
jgi:DNA polymerase